MMANRALDELLSQAIALCGAAEGESAEAATLFAAIAARAQVAPANPKPPAPHRLPACRHLAPALSLAAKGPAAGISNAFAAMDKTLCWVQNPNYVADPAMAGFLPDYGYVELAGPGGIAHDEKIALGILLIGPGRLYPQHSHPAREAYLVLAGDAEWRRDGEPWRMRVAGALIHHTPNQTHAMRTSDQPLLALYAWQGDIATAASLV